MERLSEISQLAYSNEATLLHTYNTVLSLIRNGIPGDLVECGVGAGAQIATMQLALEEAGESRDIIAFDSYEGIPLAGQYDETQPGIGAIKHDKMLPERERLKSSGITVHSVENVKRNLDQFNIDARNISFIKGWFQDILPYAARPHIIALLRLDGDLYESTLCCLKWLYPKVSNGGICIIDDDLVGVDKALYDYFGESMPQIMRVENTGVRYFIKK